MGIDVLVVDDDPDIRGPLAELLSDEGFSVEELPDAVSLCDALETYQPSVVLLDLTLPGADIESVLAEARRRQLTPGRTMLALSGLDDAPRRAEELGLDGVIQKPFDIDYVVARIHAAQRASAQPSSPASPPSL